MAVFTSAIELGAICDNGHNSLMDVFGVYGKGVAQVGLLKFWLAAQELRRPVDRKTALAVAGQAFYSFFHGANPIMKVDKVPFRRHNHLGDDSWFTFVSLSSFIFCPQSVLKGMEGFITGDRGPESFFQAQDQAWKVLEERYYPSFLVVLTCRMASRNQGVDTTESASSVLSPASCSTPGVLVDASGDGDEESLEWSEQTQVASHRFFAFFLSSTEIIGFY